MRLTILGSTLTSYSVAFYCALAEREGCKLQLVYHSPRKNAPYDGFDLAFCESVVEYGPEKRNILLPEVQKFRPDCILMSSWNFPYYMDVSLKMRRRGVYVVASMDNQWHGTFKQRLGILASPWLLRRRIDNFLVAGDRQAEFARKLGYDNVLYGFYAGETQRYWCDTPLEEREPAFLFIGRLVREKGIREMVAAYREYRNKTITPWPLKIVGKGPLEDLIATQTGIQHVGFVQPADLPQVMRQARCFLLPSTWEPWGVVIHEAASAHLPVIASYESGAVTYFVRDGVNGFVIPSQADAIATAMTRISRLTSEELQVMGDNSGRLASLWNPTMLAGYFINRLSTVV